MRQRKVLVVVAALSLVGLIGTAVGCNKLTTQPSQIADDSTPVVTETQSGVYQVAVTPDGTPVISNAAGQRIELAELETVVAAGDDIGLNLTDASGRLRPQDVNVNLGVGYISVGTHDDEDPHPLRPCVTLPVKHFHITIKQRSSTPNRQAWVHLHVGTFREGNCKRFVVYDSASRLCLKSPPCPKRGDLESMLKSAMKSALSAVHINIGDWLIAGAAVTISYAIYASLLVLI